MRASLAAVLVMGLLNSVEGIGRDSPAASGEPVRITEAWRIQLPGEPHRALRRAALDLQTFLRSRHGIYLRIAEGSQTPAIALAVSEDPQHDRFTLRAPSSRDRLIVEGSNPRAVYQGVLLLEERLAESPSFAQSMDETFVMPFSDRYLIWNALLTGQNKSALGFDLESHLREAVRLGYSGMECNRFVGTTLIQQGHPRDPYPWYTYWGPSMDQFVSSALFEGVFPREYLERNLADLKHLAATVESYGLKPIFVGYEPRYVPDAFFQRRPDLRGPRVDHPLRSMAPRYALCTDQPEVLGHYRSLAARLAREVPGIREMHVIFKDSGAGLCWSPSLYAGRNGPAHCKDVPMGERMRKLFVAIQQGFRDGGRDVEVVAQPHGATRGEIDAFFAEAPREIGLTAGNWASWSIAYNDPLGIDRQVLARLRDTGRRTIYYQQHFFGFDIAPTSEFPLVYCLAERLKRAQSLGLDALNTLGGIVSPPIKERSAMQEVYRESLLHPDLTASELVDRVARDLGGEEAGGLLLEIWKDIHATIESNRRQIGFALGTEYASRRTLVRPLVADPPALLPEEREWWLAFTFAGNLRFGHAHLFRGEGGMPSDSWYVANRDQSIRARDVFQRSSERLRRFLRDHPDAARNHPYLVPHERQLRFLGHVYATGANLHEGQRILDRYSQKNIEDELKKEAALDAERFRATVQAEIANTEALLKLVESGGDIGMVLLPEEITWGYGSNLPELLRRKVEIMSRHLPEVDEVVNRWFDSEY